MQRERDEESWAGGDGHAMPRLPPRVSRANAQRPGVVRQAEDAGGGEPPPPYVEHTADRAVAPGEGRGGC